MQGYYKSTTKFRQVCDEAHKPLDEPNTVHFKDPIDCFATTSRVADSYTHTFPHENQEDYFGGDSEDVGLYGQSGEDTFVDLGDLSDSDPGGQSINLNLEPTLDNEAAYRSFIMNITLVMMMPMRLPLGGKSLKMIEQINSKPGAT